MSRPKHGLFQGVWPAVILIVLFSVGISHGDVLKTVPSIQPKNSNPAIQLPKLQLPDLVVTSITKQFVKQTEGELVGHPYTSTEYRVRVRVENRGGGKVGAFNVRLERQRRYPNGQTGSFEEAAVLTCVGLNPGAAITLDAPGTSSDIVGNSPTVETMWWCFKATADPDNQVKELNKKNNTLVQTDCKSYTGLSMVKTPKEFHFPDLIVESINKQLIGEREGAAGQNVKYTDYRVQVMVRNIGKKQAGPFQVRVEKEVIYPYPQGQAGGYEDVAVLNCQGLDPGGMAVLNVPGTFTDMAGSQLSDNRWSCFRATADSNNVIKEIYKKNNTLTQKNCKNYN
jgi:hypothetical protein